RSSVHCGLLSFPTRRSSDLCLFQRGEGFVRFGQHPRGRALVKVQMGRLRGDFRHKLDGARAGANDGNPFALQVDVVVPAGGMETDRKSTRLNSSHVKISYAV